MKTKTFLSLLAVWVANLPISSSADAAESSARGTITGFVKNAATGDFLNNANVGVRATSERVQTASDGSYQLSLPPGRYELIATFTGLDPSSKTVEVAAGRAVALNFDLSSNIYKLDPYVVRTVREDDALSLQQQRYASAQKTVVATNAFGAPADNPGELLQRLSGISVGFDSGEVATISIRGMGEEFGTLTVDGESIASTMGNLVAVSGRGYFIHEFATSNLSQVELIKAPTPDMDADAVAGTVNMVTRRYFDQPGRTVRINASLSGVTNETHRHQSDLGRYGGSSISYSDSLGVFGASRNLGVALNAAWSRALRTSQRRGVQGAATLPNAYVNSTSSNPLTRQFGQSDWGGPIDKHNFGANVDFKLNDSSYIYAKAAYTEQDRDDSRYFVLTANSATTTAAFTPDSTYQRSTLLPNPASRLIVRSLRSARQSENWNFGTGYRLSNSSTELTLQATLSRAESRNPYFLTANAEASGIGFQIDRTGRHSAFEPAFTQTAGPNWGEPASYRITNLSNIWTTGTPVEHVSFRGDFSRKINSRIPTSIKTGLKYSVRTISEQRVFDQWTHVGQDGLAGNADDTLPRDIANLWRLGDAGYGPFPFLPLVQAKEELAPVGFWKKTAAQAYGDLTNPNAREVENEERSSAAFLMATVGRPNLRWVFGMRAETTDVESLSWIRNPSAQWGGNSVGGTSLDPAVVAANVLRAERSYVGRQRTQSRYTEWFPGVHAIWEPRDALLVRGSYNRSISRPSVVQMLPTATVNDTAQLVTIGNPDLKPYLAENFEVSVERYFEPVGIISIGLFQKNIKRYFRSFDDTIGPEGIDGSGTYAGYVRRSARNIGSAEIQGAEINFKQQFRGLPGLLAGLGAFANFTYLRAEGDFGSLDIKKKLPKMSPRVANAGLSYVGHGWQIRPLVSWRDRTYEGTSGGTDYDSASRMIVDLKLQYTLSKRYVLEFGVFNLTDAAETTWISSETNLPFLESTPGTAYNVGLTARF